MRTRGFRGSAGGVAAAALIAGIWLGCTDADPVALDPRDPARFSAGQAQGIETALAAQARHTDALMRIDGVVGTAVGLLPNGTPVVRVLLQSERVRGVPDALDGVPVERQVTGLLLARSDPTTRQRPAPVGFSTGHPLITAGTIGARVVDGSGNVYVLSNNHVLANSNNASTGDATLQPGAFDGGTVATDQIGTLFAFKPIVFTSTANNTIDAAIALTTRSDVDNTTPSDDGYGTPAATIYGDANDDGVIDNINQLLGVDVKKYGRSTRLTAGQITGVNATVNICYEVFIIFCLKSARFVDQLIIEPGSFSAGGDSGSLIVAADGTNRPVALLFGGSEVMTIANRIDLVLNEFGVSIDAAEAPPPTPLTDIAITAVSAPASITQGGTADVVVAVRNTGNQNVGADIGITLFDETDGVPVGAQVIAGGLAAGATTTRTFAWNTTDASIGSHTLRASHDFADEVGSNDTRSASVSVTEVGAATGIHVGDLTAVFTQNDGSSWSATVEVAVHDADHAPLNGATVTGTWSRGGLASTVCTTGDLGGNGTCIFLVTGLKKGWRDVTFTVTSVVMPGETYEPGQNHDDGGDSDGTSITVNRPG